MVSCERLTPSRPCRDFGCRSSLSPCCISAWRPSLSGCCGGILPRRTLRRRPPPQARGTRREAREHEKPSDAGGLRKGDFHIPCPVPHASCLAPGVFPMTIEIIIAGILLISLTFYVLLGGADFGAGVWVLMARGPLSQPQRDAIEKAIAPIWEANHVWLILVVTILFTAFPPAFARLTTVLHIPLAVMLVGIVLRGCAFAFHTNAVPIHDPRRAPRHDAAHRFWEQVFGVSSLVTPVWLGMTIGAIASGRVRPPTGSFMDSFVRPWLAAFPLSVGLLALALFAFLAAVYLAQDTVDVRLQEAFRLRG